MRPVKAQANALSRKTSSRKILELLKHKKRFFSNQIYKTFSFIKGRIYTRIDINFRWKISWDFLT